MHVRAFERACLERVHPIEIPKVLYLYQSARFFKKQNLFLHTGVLLYLVKNINKGYLYPVPDP
jgi:hypothetical protein